MKSTVFLISFRDRIQNNARRLPAWFQLFMGGILLFDGTLHLTTFLAKIPDMAEPLFGVDFRNLMLLVSLAEICLALLCLFTNKKRLVLGLSAWLILNLALYRIGLWNMGWHHPYAWVAGLTNGLQVSPRIADLINGIMWACLFIGSSTFLLLEQRWMLAAQSIKMFCPACGGKIKFSLKNAGQKIPCPHCQKETVLRQPGNLKMSCFFCHEHIEFPSHAVGEKMPCPHCKMDITLKEQV